jgi:ribosome-binding factor A
VLAELISREVRDPRVGMVTLTAVQVAPDLSVARVLFVPFGGQQDTAEVLEGLARASGFLRGEVGRRLSLRHAPRLEFVFDESIERADRLTRLIDDAVRGEPSPGEPRDDGDPR